MHFTVLKSSVDKTAFFLEALRENAFLYTFQRFWLLHMLLLWFPISNHMILTSASTITSLLSLTFCLPHSLVITGSKCASRRISISWDPYPLITHICKIPCAMQVNMRRFLRLGHGHLWGKGHYSVFHSKLCARGTCLFLDMRCTSDYI